MSDTADMLIETVSRSLRDMDDDHSTHRVREGVWPAAAWNAITDLGLPMALVEGEQGFGIPLRDGLALIRLVGRQALALPIAETMMANLIIRRAGLTIEEGPIAIVDASAGIDFDPDGSIWNASGTTGRIAWGRSASALLIEGQGRIGLMTRGFDATDLGSNLASMPRDKMVVVGPASVTAWHGLSLIEAGSISRVMLMAGALETLVELTVTHVSERIQFNRPISAFQVVQHSLARLASEAAAASAAADLATQALVADSPQLGIAIAAARARIGDAVNIATGLAHQLHGAIGIAAEHRLHRYTTALWGWRDEFGTTAWWTRRLGAAALQTNKQSYWPFVTAA